MKKIILPLFILLSISTFAQTNNELLPYNPDVDGNGIIGSPDLIGFLPLYGENFQADGVLPIELGGTGETSITDIRKTLNISAFQDDTLDVGESEYFLVGGIVNGTFKVTETFNHGFGNSVTGAYAQASGRNNIASGTYSFASNQNCSATSICASAQNEGTTASGVASHAEGFTTLASGFSSHAEGRNTTASGDYSHAQGYNTITSGDYSHAQGYNTTASGYYSHAQGRNSEATNNAATAIGYGVVADQENSLVVGKYNEENREGTLFVVGDGESDAARSNAFEVSSDGALVNGDLVVSGGISLDGQELLQIIAGLQAQIDALQAEIDGMIGGE